LGHDASGALDPLNDVLNRSVDAFERGDAARAIALLLPVLDQSDDPRIALLLGEACRTIGDDGTLVRAADRMLALNPAQIRPLIWKGDVLWRQGDQTRAGQFYGAALARAEQAQVPPTLIVELERIQRLMTSLHGNLLNFLDDYLRCNDFPEERRSARITRSISLLAGRATDDLMLQRPTLHYVPGLPQKPWYDRSNFAWAPAFEAQTDAIRAELLGVLADDCAFAPYIEGDNHGPVRDYKGLLNNPAWGAFYLWRDGAPQNANLARCPATADALRAVPQPHITGKTPTAMFSLLKPQTHIPPHHGMLNSRLICHLPLIVPEGCGMRVGDETRPWTEGQLTIFDDSVEHEAWNRSTETRVVLLFDLARPELGADEMQVVRLCFEAVAAYHQQQGR
jgi:aspartate beta-hydroxylase